MFVVVATSLGLTALRSATVVWASVIATFTFLVLLYAVVMAAYKRPFWVGFAICGAIYLGLAFTMQFRELVDLLATTKAVFLIREEYYPDLPDNQREIRNVANFVAIGQCQWALILGALGGIVAQFAASRTMAKDLEHK